MGRRVPDRTRSEPPPRTRSASAGRSTCDGRSCIVTTAANGGRRHRVVLGDGVEATHVAIDRPHGHGPAATHLGQCEVRARRQPPGVVGRGPGGREEALHQPVVADADAVAQRDGVGGGDGHALAVERVEGADGVADGQQPGRDAVITPAVTSRERVGGHRAERLGVEDGARDVRRGDGAQELRKALLVGGRPVGGVRSRRASGSRRHPPARRGRARAGGRGARRRSPSCRRRARRAASAAGGSRT